MILKHIFQIKDAKSLLETTLDNLENNWIIRPNHFLVGDKITIADLLAASEIEQTSKLYKVCVYDVRK